MNCGIERHRGEREDDAVGKEIARRGYHATLGGIQVRTGEAEAQITNQPTNSLTNRPTIQRWDPCAST